MSCKCEKCGKKCDHRLCEECFFESLDEVEKNIYLGGRFYEKKEEK